MTHVTCRLTAKNRDQLRNPSLGNRVWATFLINGRDWPEVRERLTLLVIVETSTDERSLRSQVGMGSESDCLFGQLDRILWTSDSEAGLKTEKSGGEAGGEGECGDDVVGLLVRERRSLDIFSCEKRSKAVCK